MRPIPAKDDLTICFAHVAYRMAERFALRATGIRHFQVGTIEELTARIGEADLLWVSMLWRNQLIAQAPRLAFIQSISRLPWAITSGPMPSPASSSRL